MIYMVFNWRAKIEGILEELDKLSLEKIGKEHIGRIYD